MNEFLRLFLLWTGLVLALLASLVVAPDALDRVIQSVRRVAGRYLPFLRTSTNLPTSVSTSVSASWGILGSARGDSWNPNGSVDERIDSLRNHVVQLRKLVATTEKALRELVDQKVTGVTAELDVVRTNLADLRSSFQAAEEKSSLLAARALLPILFGILLSGAPDELAHMPWLGWPLAVVGVGLVARCLVILTKHYAAIWRQRTAARLAAAAASGAN